MGYQPAHAIDALTVGSVLQALGGRGTDDIPVIESPELGKLSDCLKTFAEAAAKSPANMLLREI